MQVEQLKEIGLNEKELKVLFALREGPLSGPEIEKRTELRQPEVSRALHELRLKGYVKMLRAEKRYRYGAPCKVWTLTQDFNRILREIVGRKLVELDKKLRICVSVLFELGETISGIDPEIVRAIRELKDDDMILVELKDNGDCK
jgi:predicted transcriptional regulator